MKSDNWNFLSNLLGTPSPSEPPEEAEKKQESAERSAEGTQSSEETASEESAGDSGDRNVLDALRTAVPASVLPGFGATAETKSDDRPSANADQEPVGTDRSSATLAGPDGDAGSTDDLTMDSRATEEIDAAWGDLASELGIEPNTEPPPRREPSALPPASPASKSERRSSAKRQSSGGFGSGLGLDLGPEPEPETNRDAEIRSESESKSEQRGERSGRDSAAAGSTERDHPSQRRTADRDRADRDLAVVLVR